MGLNNKIIKYIKETKYNIGFIDSDIKSIIEWKTIKVNWMKEKQHLL